MTIAVCVPEGGAKQSEWRLSGINNHVAQDAIRLLLADAILLTYSLAVDGNVRHKFLDDVRKLLFHAPEVGETAHKKQQHNHH